MQTDAELLACYLVDHSPDAFAGLVHRHLGFVYATALRRVGFDAHLAEDVSQTVFTDLARKASSLNGRVSLRGWLFVSTHHAAAAVVRGEQRRRRRELEAQTMQMLHSDSPDPADRADLLAVLQAAVVQLRDDEREAIVLRFFEQRSFAEVGDALRLSEEAARKRVNRAVDKLRLLLGRRGASPDAALLSGLLGELGTGAAPVGLSAKIASVAVAQAVAGGALVAWMTGALAWTALLAGTGLVAYQYQSNRVRSAELAQLGSARDAIAAVRQENRTLAQSAAEAESLRTMLAAAVRGRPTAGPVPVADAPPRAPQAVVTIEANGSIRWDQERLTLADFLHRLGQLPQAAPGGDATLQVRGLAGFPALDYVINEARKAGIPHVIVESSAAPDAKKGFPWFGR